jgi:membrane-bound ClpP family serine protease
MDQTASLSPFIYLGMAIFVALALAMFAVAVLGPWIIGWLYGRCGGRLEQPRLQPDAAAADLTAQIVKQGVARRLMMPSGQVQINDRSYEAISEGPAIEAGQVVVVVKVSTRRLIVRPATG